MRPPTALHRLGYRSAYTVLRGYWFLRRPHKSGVKCVLRDGERVLLVCHTYGPREWDLPGGAIKRGEAPADAARREIQEELGVSIDQWRPLGEMFGHVDHRHDRLHCFEAQLGGGAITLAEAELEQARWFSPGELPPELGRYVRPILARLRAVS